MKHLNHFLLLLGLALILPIKSISQATKDSINLRLWAQGSIIYGTPSYYEIHFFSFAPGIGLNIPSRRRPGWSKSVGLHFVPPIGYKAGDGPDFQLVLDGPKYLQLKPGLHHQGQKRWGIDLGLFFAYMVNKKAVEFLPHDRVRRISTGLTLGLTYRLSPSWSMHFGYDQRLDNAVYESYYGRGGFLGIGGYGPSWAYLSFRRQWSGVHTFTLPNCPPPVVPARRRSWWLQADGILGMFGFSETKYGERRPFTWGASWGVGIGLDRMRVKKPGAFITTNAHYTSMRIVSKATGATFPFDVVQLKWGGGREWNRLRLSAAGTLGYLFNYRQTTESEVMGFFPQNMTLWWLGGQVQAAYTLRPRVQVVGAYDFVVNRVYRSFVGYNVIPERWKDLEPVAIYKPEWFSLGLRLKMG